MSRDRVCLQEELEKLIAGFKDDLQAKRVEKQELHTKLQKLQVRAPGTVSPDAVIVGAALPQRRHQISECCAWYFYVLVTCVELARF